MTPRWVLFKLSECGSRERAAFRVWWEFERDRGEPTAEFEVSAKRARYDPVLDEIEWRGEKRSVQSIGRLRIPRCPSCGDRMRWRARDRHWICEKTEGARGHDVSITEQYAAAHFLGPFAPPIREGDEDAEEEEEDPGVPRASDVDES